jgi:ABC-2 type transport system ATP-binding protein
MRASGLQISDALKKDLEAVLAKYKGKLEFLGHPTTTLEDLFLRIVEESKAHPGRRYLPELDKHAVRKGTVDGQTAKPEEVKKK